MVEMLGERKMALEEKVAELEEAVADLEALQVRGSCTLYYKNIQSSTNLYNEYTMNLFRTCQINWPNRPKN